MEIRQHRSEILDPGAVATATIAPGTAIAGRRAGQDVPGLALFCQRRNRRFIAAAACGQENDNRSSHQGGHETTKNQVHHALLGRK